MLPSDPTAFKIPQVPSSVLAALRLYSQPFRILNPVESSVALSNYDIDPTNLRLCLRFWVSICQLNPKESGYNYYINTFNLMCQPHPLVMWEKGVVLTFNERAKLTIILSLELVCMSFMFYADGGCHLWQWIVNTTKSSTHKICR